MFNYRNTTIACLTLLLTFVLLDLLIGNKWLLVTGFLLLVVWFTILVLSSVFIRWNFYFFSHSHGDRNSPEITITFDDGPDEKITPEILFVLDKHNIKAAFFCIGSKIEKYPEVFRSIVEKGHVIGNHSYSHSFWFDFYSSDRMAAEILKTDEIIYKLTGEKPKFFRPPYGVTNPMLRKALKATRHQSVAWSLRSLDTVKNPGEISSNLSRKLKNGDIVLFHDTIPTTSELVEQFIGNAKSRNFRFAGLEELLKFKHYETSPIKYF